MIKNSIRFRSPSENDDPSIRDINILLLEDDNEKFLDTVVDSIIERGVNDINNMQNEIVINIENISLTFFSFRYRYSSSTKEVIREIIFYSYYTE